MNLEGKGGGGSEGVGRLLDMDAREVGALCHNHRMGETVSSPINIGKISSFIAGASAEFCKHTTVDLHALHCESPMAASLA